MSCWWGGGSPGMGEEQVCFPGDWQGRGPIRGQESGPAGGWWQLSLEQGSHLPRGGEWGGEWRQEVQVDEPLLLLVALQAAWGCSPGSSPHSTAWGGSRTQFPAQASGRAQCGGCRVQGREARRGHPRASPAGPALPFTGLF